MLPRECNADSWLVEPLNGAVTHRVTGLRFHVEPTIKGLMRYGRQAALEAQGKTEEAAMHRDHFKAMWQFADVELNGSRLTAPPI